MVGTSGSFPAPCQLLFVEFPGPPSQRSVTVSSVFTATFGASGQTVNCHQAPGCVVGFSTATGSAAAYAPISFGPDIRPTPLQRNLVDGATIQVIGGDIPAGDWSIAQCGRAFVDDPTPAQAAALCAPPTPVAPDAERAFTADLVVHDPLTSSAGASVPCGYTGCVVVLAEAGQPPVSNVAISFGPPLLGVTPTDGLVEGSQVQVEVSGSPTDSIVVGQCRLPLGATRGTSQCAIPHGFTPDRWGSVAASIGGTASIVDQDDCRTGSCAFVMSDNDGVFVGDPVPITFAPPPTVTLSPTSALLDGQPISVTGQNLIPGDYTLLHCQVISAACDDGAGTLVTVGADGVLSTTIAAQQRFTDSLGQPVYCRTDECEIALNSLERGVVASSRYGLVTGAVTATPNTGLRNNQTVQISGTDLMPSYDGPRVGDIPTGRWVLTECDAAVLADLSLDGALTHCSGAPPSRLVTVEGSTLDTSLQVKARITKVRGGTTNCAASAGACVVGLVRLEQDGSLSAHLTPLTFHT